jgi:hypothetical protein
MAQNAEGAPAAAPVNFQLGLDLRFENVEMPVDAASGHAAQFAVDQRQVGKNRQRKSDKNDTECIEPA